MSSPVDLNAQQSVIRDIDGPVAPDNYIVKLKDLVSTHDHIASHFPLLAENFDSPIQHVFADELFKGYAATFNGSTLARIAASADVEYIEPDGIYSIETVRQGAVWNLSTISNFPTDTTYNYHDSAGDGTDIYIVDTGVYVDHNEFYDRATWGYHGGFTKRDGNGHGTHCAGIAAGTRYGVANQAKIIAVKVLDDGGTGYASWVIAGLQWVLDTVRQKAIDNPGMNIKSIVSMPLSRRKNTLLDDVVTKLIKAGIHVVAAAGNDRRDASHTSPARLKGVLTVGSTDPSNRKSTFSNYGKAVDVWAPGESILSAWIDDPDCFRTLSGTSMATAHATGVAALFLSQEEKGMTPEALKRKVIAKAWEGAVKDVPPGTSTALIYNGGTKGINF